MLSQVTTETRRGSAYERLGHCGSIIPFVSALLCEPAGSMSPSLHFEELPVPHPAILLRHLAVAGYGEKAFGLVLLCKLWPVQAW